MFTYLLEMCISCFHNCLLLNIFHFFLIYCCKLLIHYLNICLSLSLLCSILFSLFPNYYPSPSTSLFPIPFFFSTFSLVYRTPTLIPLSSLALSPFLHSPSLSFYLSPSFSLHHLSFSLLFRSIFFFHLFLSSVF